MDWKGMNVCRNVALGGGNVRCVAGHRKDFSWASGSTDINVVLTSRIATTMIFRNFSSIPTSIRETLHSLSFYYTTLRFALPALMQCCASFSKHNLKEAKWLLKTPTYAVSKAIVSEKHLGLSKSIVRWTECRRGDVSSHKQEPPLKIGRQINKEKAGSRNACGMFLARNNHIAIKDTNVCSYVDVSPKICLAKECFEQVG